MSPSTQPEIERKYEVPAGAEPVWGDLPRLRVEAEPDVRFLEAVYFDTPAGSLADFGLALRRRRGGPDEGWHLKFRADGTKHEVHVPLLKTADRLPAQMRQLISGVLGDQQLEPLAVVRNERQVLNVHDPELGRVAEICMDDVRGTQSATGITRAWREHEVEVVNGTGADPDHVLDEIEAVLLAAGLKPSASAAKLARTLGAEDDAAAVTLLGPDGEQLPSPSAAEQDAEGSEESEQSGKKTKKGRKKDGKKKDSKKDPSKSKSKEKDKSKGRGKKKDREADEASPDAPAQDAEQDQELTLQQVAQSMLRDAVRQVLWTDFLVRIGAADSVHGLRRAARSCEALLIGLGPELKDPDAAEEACQVVRGMSQELSALRDAEVVEQLLPLRIEDAGSAVSRSAQAQLISMAREHREAQAAAEYRRLVSTGHQEALRTLIGLPEQAELRDEAAELSPKKLGARLTGRWLDVVQDLGPVPAEVVDDQEVLEHVHAVRRAMRLLSFGAELFESTPLRAKKRQAAVLPSAEGFMDTCGELMDCRVMETWYASAARSLVRKGGDRYGVGILHGREQARLEASIPDSVLILDELFEQLDDED